MGCGCGNRKARSADVSAAAVGIRWVVWRAGACVPDETGVCVEHASRAEASRAAAGQRGVTIEPVVAGSQSQPGNPE